MKVFISIISLVLVIALTNCSSVKVKHDFDPQYDFNSYKIYKWGKMQVKEDVLATNSLVANRVVEAVDQVLKEKGYVLATDETTQADFAVVIHAGLKEKTQIDTYNYGSRGRYGWYDPWWGPYGGTTTVSQYEEGTLVIDIVDIKNKELSWRGMGTKTVQDYKSPEKAGQKIMEVVTKILAGFPPAQ